jgi:hypothetical protein
MYLYFNENQEMVFNPSNQVMTGDLEFDADALALFNRMDEQPSIALKELINTTIVGLKSDGVWALGDCLYVRGAHTAQAATLNWIKNTHNSTAVNSPLFISKIGFRGETGTYLNNNYNPYIQAVQHNLNNCSVSFMMQQLNNTTARYPFGLLKTGGSREYWISYLGTFGRMYLQSTGYNNNKTNLAKSYYGFERRGTNFIYAYQNGANPEIASSAVDATLTDLDWYELCYNYNGVATSGIDYGIVGYQWIGHQLGDSLQEKLYLRMKYFYDNYKHTEEGELVDQSLWYTSGYWNTFGANWTQNGVQLDSSGTGFLIKTGFWEIDSLYKVIVTITRSSGTFSNPYDGGRGEGSTIVAQTKEYYHLAAGTELRLYGSAFVGSLTAFSIKKLT